MGRKGKKSPSNSQPTTTTIKEETTAVSENTISKNSEDQEEGFYTKILFTIDTKNNISSFKFMSDYLDRLEDDTEY